jgi:uncharacterized protein YjbI with pentapeptide repeats
MDIETLKCPRCQTEMFDGAHFCVRCGCRLDERHQTPSKLLGSRPPAPYSELLSPGRASPVPARFESVSDALTHASIDAAKPLEPPVSATGVTVAIARPDIAASLSEIDADFGAFVAPAQAARVDAVPAAQVPTTNTAPVAVPDGTAPALEDQATAWRQSTMAEHSRDEVLRRARLKQSLKRAGLSGIDLSGAVLEGMDFARADLEGANLENAKLKGANFKSANLKNAKLNGADLSGADLDKAELEDAELDRANLEGASLNRATLDGASLDGANLANASLVGAELAAASLAGAVLRGADLGSAELTEAELGMADLSGASLIAANFQGATLDGALLHGAKIGGAVFVEAKTAGTLVDWVDASAHGDGSLRVDAPRALALVRGEALPEDGRATRYFGRGDVLRDATLEFGENSRIHVDSRFDNCSITLREGAELTIGESGVLKNCAIVGKGKVIVHGRFFERQSPGIVGVRSLVVSSRGGLVGGVEQVAEGTQFAFEPGSRLRMKILRPRLSDAAE